MLHPNEKELTHWETHHHMDGHTGNMFMEKECENSYLIDTDEIVPKTLSDAAKDTKNKVTQAYDTYLKELTRCFSKFFPQEKAIQFTKDNI